MQQWDLTLEFSTGEIFTSTGEKTFPTGEFFNPTGEKDCLTGEKIKINELFDGR
ncbi:hypothetical protein AABM38_21070 [Heyndrickxia sp. MSNUG]|uniref:hypothetical protein n=1 Tax=Heyndrickxia sp. MSNUG TaxID=3136677 RepID=UPI003C2B0C27